MSSVKSDAVKGRLVSLLGTPGQVLRVFLVVDAKDFKASVSINNDVQRMNLGGGSFAVLMLSGEDLAGIAAGIYDPDVAVDAKAAKAVVNVPQ